MLPPLPLTSSLRAAVSPATQEAAARHVLSSHGLPAEGLAPFADGSDVVWGTARHVFKLSDPSWGWQIAAEVQMLEHLTGRLPVQTPELVATGALEGWPYVVMTRIGGLGLGEVWATLGDAGRLRCAEALGELLAAFAALPLPPPSTHPEAPPRDFAAFIEDNREHFAERQRQRGAPEALIAEAEALLASWTPREAAPAWLHTELLGDHVRVTPEGLPCGLLDLADARAGHPDYELPALVEFVFKGAPGALEACLRGRGGPRPEGLLGWHLVHRYGHLPRLMKAAGQPETLAAAASVLGVSG